MHPKFYYLTIRHVESFYNYRTVGDDFNLVTSLLSSETNLMELEGSADSCNVVHVVQDEDQLSDEGISFMHLHLKRHRMMSAMTKIKHATRQIEAAQGNSEVFNYFSLNINPFNGPSNRTAPKSCRSITTKKKTVCSACNELCAYSMESVLDPCYGIAQHDIQEELSIHGHAKSKKMQNGNWRTNEEALIELAHHYVYSHNLTWPPFFS